MSNVDVVLVNKDVVELTVGYTMSMWERVSVGEENLPKVKELIKEKMAHGLGEQIIKSRFGEMSETTVPETGNIEFKQSIVLISKEELKRLKEIERNHLRFRID